MFSAGTVWRILRYPIYGIIFAWGLYLAMCSILPDKTPLAWGISTKTIDAPVVGAFAAFLATAGWITTAYIARFNSIKQHTMQVLTQARLSTELNKKAKDLYEKYPPGVKVPLKDVLAASRTEDWYRGATYMLNYYEFLSVAMRYNDLYEPLLRDCVRSQLCELHTKLQHFIQYCRDNDARVKRGEIHADQSRIYRDITRVYNVWSAR